MRLSTISVSNELRPAIVVGDKVIDLMAARALAPAARLLPADMLGILAGEQAARTLLTQIVDDAATRADAYAAQGALMPLAQVTLAAPLANPRMILSIGANYHEHLKEMNTPPPATPMGFHKALSSVIGPEEPIVLPRIAPDMVDWEGEFTIVMGRACHNVSEDEALDYVAGYTIINDVSARDWVVPAFQAQGMINTIVAWEHNILGKLFPTFCPMGPVIVTTDEIRDPHNLKVETRLNGAVMQSSNTSDLVFNVKQIIAYYSKFLTFHPGDMISTGSPSGVGFGRKPPIFMKAGDTIEVTIETIGTLRNPIVADIA